MLSIDIAGAIDDYVRDLDRELPALLTQAAHYAAMQMADRSRKLAPHDTGALRASIHTVPEEKDEGGWKVAAATSAGVHYAFYQEYGTGSKGDPQTFDGQPILHTDKKQWMFEDPRGVTRYGHPMEGKHFMSDAYNEQKVGREIRKYIVRRLNA